MKFTAAYKLAFIYQSVVNGVVNPIVVIISHLVKLLVRIHKTQLKVKFCFVLFTEAAILKTIKYSLNSLNNQYSEIN